MPNVEPLLSVAGLELPSPTYHVAGSRWYGSKCGLMDNVLPVDARL